MHSSRMRTTRLLTVSRSIGGGVCLPWGCLPSCNGADTPPEQNDNCKNITLFQTSACYITVKVCFHIASPCPSRSKFYIVSMVTNRLIGRMGFRPILSVDVNLTETAMGMRTSKWAFTMNPLNKYDLN